jgi:hypothetical protein
MVSERWIPKRDSIWTMELYMKLFSAVFTTLTVFTS